ncbi:MAG: hypothetical protein N0E54_04220 [Candidatus Thiodiazotropha taylori]|nr:hypothetical protein [Candidatus Thiodiazotropha endolucinida]MCG8053019.1 hypothetical protein [Candidatus Thiodiazotropha taylori]MCW4227935.1 hypothetical protein [Candidatus Thiodiazotropha taylori]MCW4314839.1 hypothetical protein [Candidatus Thiodiazotropha taylori]
MNKKEAIWIVIRFAGLFLAVKALMELPELLSSLWFVFSVGPDLVTETPGAKFAVKATLKETAYSLIAIALYGLGAFYFLRRGKSVFNLIRVPSDNE